MNKTILFIVICFAFLASAQAQKSQRIVVGSERVKMYLPMLQGKRVAVLTNQTGRIGNENIVDFLHNKGVNIVTIFSPEHGFRGKADAGEKVGNSIDAQTGISIHSLYGGTAGKMMDSVMQSIDVVLFDLQDVGLRYYTYLTTMVHVMNACAIHHVQMIVLDRPNPNGFYVDGPILDMKYKSGVGSVPVPVVHGMTLGELARMINGEHWLTNGVQCNLTVIPCLHYTHAMHYQLPVKPSPNLPNMRSVYLYPSLCYFEATPVSIGRGTDAPFQQFGSPRMKGYSYSFMPRSMPGATNPPCVNQRCYGVNLQKTPTNNVLFKNGIDLTYLIEAYRNLNMGDAFFSPFFERLIGVGYVRQMIEAGASASAIKARWKSDDEKFEQERRPYLLYPEGSTKTHQKHS